MNLFVRTVIRTVDIAINGRSKHGVIECGVEVYPIVLMVAFDCDFRELPVPVVPCSLTIFIEIILRNFGYQILSCSFHADTGKGCVDKYLLSFLCVEIESGYGSRTHSFSVFQDGSCIHLNGCERFREACTEIDVLVACPSVGEAVSLNGYRVDNFDVRIIGKVPIHSFFQVEEDSGFGFRKSVTLNAASFGCRQFDVDAVIFQQYLVISCRGTFVLMGKFGVNT